MSASKSMQYRRLFIMRKDLDMSPGKLAAQVAHCAEAYWLRMIQDAKREGETVQLNIPDDIFTEYINGSIVKTICQAKNKSKLMGARQDALDLGLVEDVDFGFIRDNCYTELKPEELDGTVITGIWFCPLPDDLSHEISKHFQLYR